LTPSKRRCSVNLSCRPFLALNQRLLAEQLLQFKDDPKSGSSLLQKELSVNFETFNLHPRVFAEVKDLRTAPTPFNSKPFHPSTRGAM